MNKQGLQKKVKEIILKTNGGNDDYVVALCKISNAINELDDDSQCVAELKTKLEQSKTKIKEFETENKRLEKIVDNYKSKTKQLCKDKFTAIENMDNSIRNRDKIAKEFAIEKLEKIKDFFVKEDEDGYIDVTKDIFEVVEYINTLITKLKGEISNDNI